jgi:hypothetical protein
VPKRTESGEGQFLTQDEERRLGESLRKALISDKPNPSREGCPDPKTLRDLAFHKRIGNPELFEQTTAHMAECSACVRDALGYAEEYKEVRKRRRTSRAALLLAAAVVVAVASWAVWSLQQKPGNLEIAREAPPNQPPGTPVATTGGGKLPAGGTEIAQYQTVTIQLPSRLRASTVAAPQIILGRGRLLLEIRLSNGSPEGKYKFRILDKSGEVQKTIEATATTQDHVTRLKIPLDTSGLAPGDYTLSVLEPGLDDWVDYPLRVK